MQEQSAIPVGLIATPGAVMQPSPCRLQASFFENDGFDATV
jgi:hypothetical protein